MRSRRLAPALLIAAAACALPATAAARGIVVSTPKSVTAYTSFGFDYQGDTGPAARIGGGFITRVTFTYGKAGCPANAQTSAKTIAAVGGGDNVFHSGSFKGAGQAYFSRTGTVRVCGYISTDADTSQYEQLFTKTIKVKPLRRGEKYDLSAKKLKDGTYSGGAGDIIGGSPASSISIVVAGGKVTSVTAAGIPNTACSPDFRTQTQITGSASSTTPRGTDNPVIGSSFNASFTSPTGNVSVNADGKSSKVIYGSITSDSTDGSCRGGFGFTAKR